MIRRMFRLMSKLPKNGTKRQGGQREPHSKPKPTESAAHFRNCAASLKKVQYEPAHHILVDRLESLQGAVNVDMLTCHRFLHASRSDTFF